MNGIIHNCAQQIYQYGKYQPKCPQIILKKPVCARVVKDSVTAEAPTIHKVLVDDEKEQRLFALIKKNVNELIKMSNPQKSVFLAIDGVAPQGKQNQQRQRRFRAAKENTSQINNFDSNCITAGTDFMRRLATNLERLDWVCKKEIDITFSSDSSPGEGEHKLIDWIRSYDVADTKNEVYTVVGMDADLILLCMCLRKQNVFILRENEKGSFDWIDIEAARSILRALDVTPEDLVVWACFIGNDFLPPIPSLEIKESDPEKGALDFFFDIFQKYFPKYFESLSSCALLVNKKNGHINFRALKFIFQKISERELDIMKARHSDRERFINEMWKGNIEDYRIAYHENKLKKSDKATIVISYLKSAQWVYEYYSKGIPSWDWYYPYNYTLHANDFAEYCPLNVLKFSFRMSEPSHPHEQLLRVIPPLNKHLIPSYLYEEFEKISKKSNTFKIDKAGKREEWEAVTIVDFVELDSKIIYKKI